MDLFPLPKAATAEHGWTHKAIVTHEDLAAMAAAATGVQAIFPSSGNFNAGTIFGNFAYKLKTQFDFSDAAITGLTMQIGITGGDTDKYLTAQDLAADGTPIDVFIEGAVTTPAAENTADTVDALFTASGGASPLVSEATSGEVHIYFRVIDPTELEEMQA